jgi:hypothetical protein
MDPNVQDVERPPYRRVRRRGCRSCPIGHECLRLRRRCREEGEPDRVLAGIAGFQMHAALGAMGRQDVVLVSREAVVVLWMVVARVLVDVQAGERAPAGGQGQSEQHCGQATHDRASLYEMRGWGQSMLLASSPAA